MLCACVSNRVITRGTQLSPLAGTRFSVDVYLECFPFPGFRRRIRVERRLDATHKQQR